MCSDEEHFKILNFNVGGLAARLVSAEFTRFLTSFDLIYFTETFFDEAFEMKMFKDYQPFIVPAKKLSRQGRKSGGVLILLHKGYAQFFKRIDVRFDNFVVLDMAAGFMSHDNPVMCVFRYIPPQDSPAYAQTDSGKRIKMTEHCFADSYKITNDFYLFYV